MATDDPHPLRDHASGSPPSETAAMGLLFAPPPVNMPIPDRLNMILVACVLTAAVGLLWLGSWVERWYAVAGVGVVFSYVLLTNYALLHEATHGNLHCQPRVNFWLGVLTGILFPMPFSMVRTTHGVIICATGPTSMEILIQSGPTSSSKTGPPGVGETSGKG